MKIKVREISEEWRGIKVFKKIIFYPYSLQIDWKDE